MARRWQCSPSSGYGARAYYTSPVLETLVPVTSGTATTVFTVHSARDNHIGEIAAIYTDQHTAERHARDTSCQARMDYAAVTAFHLDQLGSRSPVAWFKAGQRQRTPWPTVSGPVFDAGPDRGAAARRRNELGITE